MRGLNVVRLIYVVIGLVALAVICVCLRQLYAAGEGVAISVAEVNRTPVTIFVPKDRKPLATVVIAHGFAGSQQLMQSFALTFARNGYAAVTFDLPGYGRNPKPLTGSLTDVAGATRVLVEETRRIVDFARGFGDGRLAVLGHSMSSDIVVRLAEETPDVKATIAVSMFSPAVTATSPANLLVIVGDWEGMLKEEALRVVGLVSAPATPQAGTTYGDIRAGTARRAAFSAHVEHASVLYSQDSMREALAWLDATFGVVRSDPPALDARGPWIMALFAGVVVLGLPLARGLPRIAVPPVGAGLGWKRFWLPLLVPMIVVPLILRVVPTHFLPMLVGDYLAVHFFAYGLATLACLAWARSFRSPIKPDRISLPGFGIAVFAACGFSFVGFIWPINTFVTSFVPGPERFALVAVMLVGTLVYFLSDEWLTRGLSAARGGYPASKLAFLTSLGIAIALDFERLFFLIIIVPVILLFFLIFGLFSRWIFHSTGHPLVAGIVNAIVFAWAIGVTFPILAG